MTKEELHFIYPNADQILIDSKYTAEAYKNLMMQMVQNNDNNIVEIGNFYPLWIIDLCRRAKKSITVFSEDKDIKIFRFLQKELSNPNLQVHLLINKESEDFSEQKFINEMQTMKRIKIHPSPILAGTSLVIDDSHFLLKRAEEKNKKYFFGAYYQPDISKKIQTILSERWEKTSKRILYYPHTTVQERAYTK
ncbi:MAG: hypothetical protein IKV03_00770 [Alphaproteobacteria bacterium]|nr:hypothetical protein [Alphaproteobacteria bacterium]